MPELWDGNNGPIAEGNLFHSRAEGQILYCFFPPSHDIMGVYGPLQPLHMYKYRGVAVQLLLFILCDPLLLCDLLFIYLWRYSPSHDILGAEKPEGPFENLLLLKNFFCPSGSPSSPSPG